MGLIRPLSFKMLANPTLPKFYWEVKSQEQLIAYLSCYLDALKDHVNETGDQVNENTSDIDWITDVVESIENGGYFDKYVDGLAKWIDENIQELVGRIARYVFPTFYYDGECWRYAMVVPKTWDFLRFRWEFCEDGTFHILLVY